MARTRRTRRRYNQEPATAVLARGAVVLAALGAMMWLAATLYNGIPGRSYQFVTAIVPDSGSLILHDAVRMGGVRVGQVRSIDTAPDGRTAIKLQLEPETRVPRDSRLQLRANGLLGQRYVEIQSGRSSQYLADGATLRGDERSLTYGVTDALDTFDAETRGALRPMVAELGRGTLGQGQNVNDLVRLGAANISPVTALFTELRRPQAGIDGLLPSLNSGMTVLDRRRVTLAQVPAAAADAVAPLIAERPAVRNALEAAPTALAAATAGTSAARPLLAAARDLSRNLTAVLPTAPVGLRSTTALLNEGRRPVQEAKGLLKDVGGAVPATVQLTAATDPLLRPATGLLNDVRRIATTVGPYGCDLTNFGAVFRSMTGLGTTAGGGPNGPAMQFRLQAAATPAQEVLALSGDGGLGRRDGYPAPCKYLAKEYPIFKLPELTGGGR